MEDSRQEEQEEEVNATIEGLFICEICVEPSSENKKFKKNNSHCCVRHFLNIKYVELQTASSNMLQPREIVPQSVFAKWCDVLCDNYVLGLERSYCPNRNCRELVVNECGGQAKKKSTLILATNVEKSL
ncbi:uncharacterized protein LOC123220866 [Mangifera indica]|uniref:uncharacterized protein LOC123220866 n=1 Tax=Mangifera indica TaxID=29780 RepID=UPI001CF9E763|nr:uncharacterized protein LOC123220866 [Mangifera indica]